jgi:hypothetical protein
MTIDRIITMGTDVACFLIFHPDDLTHAAGWPIAWYAEPFIYPAESEAKRLIGWQTRGDGTYAIRFTDGELTERERSYAGPSWTFPYRVTHGRIFIDNSDGLPGVERMIDPAATPEGWVDVPNGDYAVSVTGIEWRAEPGALDMGEAALSDYVVQFAPATGATIPSARRPPDLRPTRDDVASDMVPAPQRREPEQLALPPLVPILFGSTALPPPHSFTIDSSVDIEAVLTPNARAFDTFYLPYVVTFEEVGSAPGSIAVLARLRQTSSDQNNQHQYGFSATALCRVIAIEGYYEKGVVQPLEKRGLFGTRAVAVPAHALMAARVEPLAAPDAAEALPGEELLALRAASVAALSPGGALAAKFGAEAGYQAHRVAAFSHDWQLAEWLLAHVPMPEMDRLSIAQQPSPVQCRELSARLNALQN